MSFENNQGIFHRSADARTRESQYGGSECSYTNFSVGPRDAVKAKRRCGDDRRAKEDFGYLELLEDDVLMPPPRSTGIHLKSQAEMLNASETRNGQEEGAEDEKPALALQDQHERQLHRYIRRPQPIEAVQSTAPARRSKPSRLPVVGFRPERSRPLPQQLSNLKDGADDAKHASEDIAEQFRRARQQSDIVRRRLQEYAYRQQAEMAAAAEIERQEALLAAEQHERELQIRRMEQLTRMHRLQERREAEKERWAQPPECAQAGLYKWRAEEIKKRDEEARRLQEFEKARQEKKLYLARKLSRSTHEAASKMPNSTTDLKSAGAAADQNMVELAPEQSNPPENDAYMQGESQPPPEASKQDLSVGGTSETPQDCEIVQGE